MWFLSGLIPVSLFSSPKPFCLHIRCSLNSILSRFTVLFALLSTLRLLPLLPSRSTLGDSLLLYLNGSSGSRTHMTCHSNPTEHCLAPWHHSVCSTHSLSSINFSLCLSHGFSTLGMIEVLHGSE